jgi:hypothetical protein
MMGTVLLMGLVMGLGAGAAFARSHVPPRTPPHAASFFECNERNTGYCAEAFDVDYEGKYVGHDEPALLFYSNIPGSGNSSIYRLTLPKDPPTLPNQAGTAGVFSFQVHATIWLGMVLCDTESSPEYTKTCVPNTDANIFDGADPNAPDFIGHHPGSAYMEVQFYPPGWVGPCFDPTHWCAALTLSSNNVNQLTGQQNNVDCLNKVGSQPGNLAFITKNGVPIAPGNPLGANFGTYNYNLSNILTFNGGDKLVVDIRDSPQGVRAIVRDLTTGRSGSMTAGASTGFGQVIFDPSATTCQVRPYDFHPMYSTSSEHTRSTWTAHSFNVAFSDEIGHFEVCEAVDADGNCTVAGADEHGGGLDDDDFFCFAPPSPLLPPSLVQIGGCTSADTDYDSISYQTSGWPGTKSGNDKKYRPTPIRFTSPQFIASGFPLAGLPLNFSRVAFETDLPNVERSNTGAPPCNVMTGANCVNPPPGATFYPIYTTTLSEDGCSWQFGGAHIPGTLQTFGGNSTAEYGPLLPLLFLRAGNVVMPNTNFRQILPYNPCPSFPIF